MTISLGGIPLSEDLTLTGTVNSPNVLMQIDQTLGGGIYINGLSLVAGRELVLESKQSGNAISGFFTGSEVSQLVSFRDAMQKIVLVHHLGTFDVIITEIDLEPANETVNPQADTWYIGSVTMVEV